MTNSYTQEMHDYIKSLDVVTANNRRLILEQQIKELQFELDLVKSHIDNTDDYIPEV